MRMSKSLITLCLICLIVLSTRATDANAALDRKHSISVQVDGVNVKYVEYEGSVGTTIEKKLRDELKEGGFTVKSNGDFFLHLFVMSHRSQKATAQTEYSFQFSIWTNSKPRKLLICSTVTKLTHSDDQEIADLCNDVLSCFNNISVSDDVAYVKQNGFPSRLKKFKAVMIQKRQQKPSHLVFVFIPPQIEKLKTLESLAIATEPWLIKFLFERKIDIIREQQAGVREIHVRSYANSRGQYTDGSSHVKFIQRFSLIDAGKSVAAFRASGESPPTKYPGATPKSLAEASIAADRNARAIPLRLLEFAVHGKPAEHHARELKALKIRAEKLATSGYEKLDVADPRAIQEFIHRFPRSDLSVQAKQMLDTALSKEFAKLKISMRGAPDLQKMNKMRRFVAPYYDSQFRSEADLLITSKIEAAVNRIASKIAVIERREKRKPELKNQLRINELKKDIRKYLPLLREITKDSKQSTGSPNAAALLKKFEAKYSFEK